MKWSPVFFRFLNPFHSTKPNSNAKERNSWIVYLATSLQMYSLPFCKNCEFRSLAKLFKIIKISTLSVHSFAHYSRIKFPCPFANTKQYICIFYLKIKLQTTLLAQLSPIVCCRGFALFCYRAISIVDASLCSPYH